MVTAIACVIVGAAIIAGVVLLVRRANRQLGHYRTVATRASERAKVSAAQTERVTGMVQEAVQVTHEAIDVARQIEQVHAKVDRLLDRTADDERGVPSRGRHARLDLYVVDGKGREIA